MSVIQKLHKQGLIKPPPFVVGGTQYETIMGSVAYHVSSDTSDVDIYGFCIPPKDVVFPHLAGQIPGFGTTLPNFEQFQQHHVLDTSTGKEYDMNIYSIVKYFNLCMDNNPNMIDSLFTPENCVLHATRLARHIRDNRKLFLHKGSWHKFKGYAYSQMHKMKIKNPDPTSKRYASIVKYGYDVKFAYHVVRLLNEVEMILNEGDLDLTRNNEQLKAIRRGDWTQQEVEEHFASREKALQSAYENSKLPFRADEQVIKNLLLQTLEEHYGSISDVAVTQDRYKEILREIQELTFKYSLT
jgi:predicted nucleotidyltransferase